MNGDLLFSIELFGLIVGVPLAVVLSYNWVEKLLERRRRK